MDTPRFLVGHCMHTHLSHDYDAQNLYNKRFMNSIDRSILHRAIRF